MANFDELYMQRAIDLATIADKVSPNPKVGALLVYKEKIISEAWHEAFGEAHAERLVIEKVIKNFSDSASILQSSSLYITLEPCTHFGKTPPCADFIIKHRIPKIVVGALDPNPIVNNHGIQKLKQAGLKVVVGVLEDRCRNLNKYYYTFYEKKRPYIIIKWAESKDSYFTPKINTRYQLTDTFTSIFQHKYRSKVDAILVGYNTAKIDNPLLNNRHWFGKAPIRIILDRDLSLPKNLNIFDTSVKTFIFNETKSYKRHNVEYIQIDFTKSCICKMIIDKLYELKVQSVIIEGGKETINLFLDINLWDEMRIFQSPIKLECGVKAPLRPINLTPILRIKLLKDCLEVYNNSI